MALNFDHIKILSQEFKDTLSELENADDNYFITGKAGTGKSTLLRLFSSSTKKKHVVLAPTGIAALNVAGQTIHSFFSFPPRIIRSEDIKVKKRFSKLYKSLDCIIIDEISMVRADVLDGINWFLQLNRQNNAPFGGVQIIAFGDLFQLPPVLGKGSEREIIKMLYGSPFFFNAEILQTNQLIGIELKHIFRQESALFKNILNRIRMGRSDADDLILLNNRCEKPKSSQPIIKLSTVNYKVDAINQKELSNLDGSPKIFIAEKTGTFPANIYPTEEHLVLKKEAQVMFIKNDQEGRFVNGTLGVVKQIEPNLIIETEEKNELIAIEKAEWENVQYVPSIDSLTPKFEVKVLGSFKQYPLKLAWAMTIHKSQGKTFDQVNVDLDRGAFEHGQTYVALSRCRTMEGLYLSRPIQPKDIFIYPEVVDYYKNHIE